MTPARDREIDLIKQAGEIRWPIPVSELSKYVSAVIATNGILINNAPANELFGGWH